MESESTSSNTSPTNISEFYADSLRLSVGPFSVGFEFGVLPFSPDDISQAAMPVARVRMSPQLAQATKQLLIENMDLYESLFGPLKVPAGFTDSPGPKANPETEN